MKFPIIPQEVKITPAELFHDKEKANKWYKSILDRKAAISEAVKEFTALKFTDPDDPQHYQIISPSTKGYRYQITTFDALGAVYDCQRNDSEDVAEEINRKFVLSEVA